MKVVYKRTVSEQVYEIVCAAKIQGHEIDYVELTQEEWIALRRELRYTENASFNNASLIYGMRIKIVDVKDVKAV